MQIDIVLYSVARASACLASTVLMLAGANKHYTHCVRRRLVVDFAMSFYFNITSNLLFWFILCFIRDVFA